MIKDDVMMVLWSAAVLLTVLVLLGIVLHECLQEAEVML